MRKILVGLLVIFLFVPTLNAQQNFSCYRFPDAYCKKYTRDCQDDKCLEPRSAEETEKYILAETIYNNCYLSMLSEVEPDKDYKEAVEQKCGRIAENPSFWDKIKYSD